MPGLLYEEIFDESMAQSMCNIDMSHKEKRAIYKMQSVQSNSLMFTQFNSV